MHLAGLSKNINVKDKWLIFVVFIVVNLPILVFFYDYFNLNVTIYGASFLFLGINPYQPETQIVAGFLILPYNLFSFLIYYISNYSILTTYVALKLIGLFLIFLTSLIILKIVGNNTNLSKRLLVSSIILSPILLYVNDVGMSTIAVPMFLVVLSYYFIFHNEENSSATLFTGALSIVLAGFVYYFPILFIPSFLIFSSDNRKRVKLFSFILFFGILFEWIQYYFNLSSSFIGALSGGYPAMYPYSILNILPLKGVQFLLEHQFIVTLILILLSFLIPLLARHYKSSIAISVVILLTIALILQPNGTYPDSYAIVVPFIVIILVEYNSAKITYFNILLPQLFVIPQFLISQLFNGPGYVTGIFYSLYTTLHSNILIYDEIPYAKYIWYALLILTVIFATVSIAYLWKLSVKSENAYFHQKTTKKIIPPVKTNRTNMTIIAILLILFIVVIPMLAENSIQTSTKVDSNHNFPTMLFLASSSSSVYWLPSPNTYEIQGNVLNIFPQSPSVYFYRNLSGQEINFSFKLNVSNFNINQVAQDTLILNTNIFNLSVQTQTVSNNSKLNLLLTNLYNNQSTVYPLQDNEYIGISSSGNTTSLTIGENLSSYLTKIEHISFGKISNSLIGLTFNFNTLSISTNFLKDNYLIIIACLTILSPALMYSVYFLDRCRKRFR